VGCCRKKNGKSELIGVRSSHSHSTHSYIIDFEDCTLLDPNTETPPDFQEGVYDGWELSEEVVSLYRRRSGWDKAVQQT
jgi:hypothetical protein